MARRRTAVRTGRPEEAEEPRATRPQGAGERLPAFRNRRGEQVAPRSFSASDAKNQFGRVLEAALADGIVMITKHDAVKAVLVSVDEFTALTGAREPALDTLSREFDRQLARMQTPKSRAGMRSAFEATPKQLGQAAVEGARRRA
jgi:antitoxin Phd